MADKRSPRVGFAANPKNVKYQCVFDDSAAFDDYGEFLTVIASYGNLTNRLSMTKKQAQKIAKVIIKKWGKLEK